MSSSGLEGCLGDTHVLLSMGQVCGFLQRSAGLTISAFDDDTW